MVAGLCAGIVEAALCVVPMTSVQVRMCHDLGREQPQYRGLLHGVCTIVAESGVGALYQVRSCRRSNDAVRAARYYGPTCCVRTCPPLPCLALHLLDLSSLLLCHSTRHSSQHSLTPSLQAAGPTILKLGVNMAVRFTLYERIKGELMARSGGASITDAQSLLAGGLAGAISVVLNHPVRRRSLLWRRPSTARWRRALHVLSCLVSL
jgi:hypothetical protein